MVGTRKLLRGHYNPTNWTRKYPNLQYAVTPGGERVLACTKCIKTFGKAARMAKRKEKKIADAAAKAAAPAPEVKKEAPKKEKKEPKTKKPAK